MEFIFVFGSNKAGRHGAGAALYAQNHYGAKYGIGEGLTGKAYALPTKDEKLRTLSYEAISKHMDKFLSTAAKHKDKLFVLTPVGTGRAGYSKCAIGSLLYEKGDRVPSNVVLHKTWLTYE